MGRYKARLNVRLIDRARLAKGWTIKRLAEKAALPYDITRATLREVSSGPETVRKICTALGIETASVWR